MKKMNQAAILTGLTQAMVNQSPVKLVVNGRIEPYFGTVLDISDERVTIEYHDCVEPVFFMDITNLFS